MKAQMRIEQLTFDLSGPSRRPHPNPVSPALSNPNPMRGRVRKDDLPTSRAGAAKAALHAGSQKAKLLAVYARSEDGLTDEQAAELAVVNMRSCWWKRCNELRQLGFIQPVTDARGRLLTRTSSAQVQRMVCFITPLGREALASNFCGAKTRA